jgi:predicted PurR-regulated permease PerM
MKISTIISIILLGFCCFFIYQINYVILSFILSFIISYLLLPLCNKIENYTHSRSLAAFLSIFITFIVSSSLFLFIPYFILQLKDSVINLPISNISFLKEYYTKIFNLVQTNNSQLKEYIHNNFEDIGIYLLNFSTKIVNSSSNLLNLISFALIIPLISYYFLKDWNQTINNVQTLIPPRYRLSIIRLSKEAGNNLLNYIHGQVLSCLILALLYGTTLHLIKLNLGFLIGLMIGIFSFIPFIVHITGFIISLIIGLIQYGSLKYSALIIIVFLILQIIENNFIIPKFIGERIGVHPLLILFAFMVGSSLFGFVGILLTLPILTLLIGVMRFGLDIYKNSKLYE